MVKAKQKKRAPKAAQNWDGVFMLKMVLYLILGSMWVKISHGGTLHIPVPVGFIVGLLFAVHEHFQIDRKLEYTLLLAAMLIGYVAPFGLYINF
jgi:hypothetical protein